MAREIKFRGIFDSDEDFLDNGDVVTVKAGAMICGQLVYEGSVPWIVGPVIETDDEYIALEWWYRVKPETVGQFTGLKDKNGKEIFEGDVLAYTDDGMEKAMYPHWHGVVIFGPNQTDWEKSEWPSFHVTNLIYKPIACEIIGNIYENPELLTEKAND